MDQARRQVETCVEAGGHPHRHRRRLLQRAGRGYRGRGPQGRHDAVLLATKVRMPMGRGPNDAGLSRHHVISGCEASLRRLGTEHIDLYQVHEWDEPYPARGAFPGKAAGPARRPVGGQGPLCGRVQLRLLAADEGAGHGREVRPAAVRQPADLLLPAGPRGRVRAHPARGRPGPGRAGVEPAAPGMGCCPARTAGVTRPRRARGSSPTGASRRSTIRKASMTPSRSWSRSPSSTASRPPRSPSPTSWPSPPSPRW